MLTFTGGTGESSVAGSVSRRGFLRIGGIGMGGLTLPGLLRLQALSAAEQTKRRKSLIIIYLNGGASQHDMFDLKPDAPDEFRGEFKPVQTNVPGILVSEHLPNHTKLADRYSIVNGLQWVNSGHSLYEPSTGFSSRQMPKRPALGAVVSRLQPDPDPELPGWVKMAGDHGPEYLGAAHGGFNPSGGLMSDIRIAGGIPQNRTQLLRTLDQQTGEVPAFSATDTYTQQALDMMRSTPLTDALDLKQEPDEIKNRYSKESYGGVALLQALRLAEAGVAAITVYGPGNGKWDTHKDNFKVLKEKVLPEYDKSIPAMIEDLYARGLDQDVLVAVYGEFGRTPRINKNAGRDHYPQSGFVQLFGGGLKMGQVIGDTGVNGDWDISRSRPYTIQNLLATFYHHLGIDPSIKIPDNFGRPQYLLEDREPIAELL